MFRVVELGPAEAVRVWSGDAALPQIARPPEGVLRWIDLADQDEAQLELLRARFDLHPLAIEDCLHLDQRPKVEDYRDSLFIVVHGFTCPDDRVGDLVPEELHVFLMDRVLITVHATPNAALETTWRRVAGSAALAERGIDFLFYLIVDGMADANFPIVDKVAEELEELEEAVLDRPRHEQLSRIFALKHDLAIMRRVLSPQRDVLAGLSKRGDGRVSERTSVYLRDVYDHLVRLSESIDANRDLLGNALDAYLSSVSNRTNEIMKYLTIMSAVFLPLAFVVGFFGQNFDNLPGLPGWVHSDGLMWFMLGLCVGVPVTMVYWFKRKGWL